MDKATTKALDDRGLSRIALYNVLLAWIGIAFYIYLMFRGEKDGMAGYFFSKAFYGSKFRPLTLLGPFALNMTGYLINEKVKFFRKNLVESRQWQRQAMELERANVQLSQQAFYDPLTNLPNRALFLDHLNNALERKKRYRNYSFAVFFLDLDRFKVVNDGLGHIIGDQLLIMVAQRLKKQVRSIDIISRFGGDEFVILVGDIKDLACVEEIAGRLKKELKPPFFVFGHEIFVTMSMGIVLSGTVDYKKPDEILRDADTAMYQAKSLGKSCHVIFNSVMYAEATMAYQFETELRRALEHNEFLLHYQPIVSLLDNKIVGMEALLRWDRPERGIVSASQFINVAEETGLLLTIDPWTIREACGQLKKWRDAFPDYHELTVSVNVSAEIFSQPGFYELVEGILRDTGLAGKYLRLEITERALIQNPEPAAELIKRFGALGVSFDIDDFGTGYSALNYLRHFPIRGLKIDGSFIKALPTDENNKKIVKTIVALGNDLGLDVIAEGIESFEQINIYKNMNGHFAQGFYLFGAAGKNVIENLLAGD